jgi:hypothetical protein
LDLTRNDWRKARKKCLEKGAGLVAIHNEKEEKEIRKYIKSKNLQTMYFWIG